MARRKLDPADDERIAGNLEAALERVSGSVERRIQEMDEIGLSKMGATVTLTDNVSVRGMIRSVSHLVRVEKAE